MRHVLIHAVELSKDVQQVHMDVLSKLAFIYSGDISDIDIATHFVTLCVSNICELLKANTDTDRKTVLHMACSENKSDMVAYLLQLFEKHGCFEELIFAFDSDGNSALHPACSFSVHQAGAAKILLKAIIKHDAASGGTELLEKALFLRNECGDTPLGHACRHASDDHATYTVETLLTGELPKMIELE